MANELALVESKDLSLISNNVLNAKQLAIILKKTPDKYVHKRPAKGGGQWDYVTGGYMRKVLNLMFGWDWDFEILEEKIMHGEVIVKGRLTCRCNGASIIKTQYGNKDIVFKKNTEIPLSIGNDLKSAATDCLKKCAAEIGIAADIYNKMDFKEIHVTQDAPATKEEKEAERLSQLIQSCNSIEDLNRWEKDAFKLGIMMEFEDRKTELSNGH